MKHSKFKNVLFLHNLLVQQITNQIIDNKQSKAISIYQKFFKTGSLRQQLKLYKLLYNPNSKIIKGDRQKARQLIQVACQKYKKIDRDKNTNLKYRLIYQMKKVYNLQQLMRRKYSQYSLSASIYKLLQISCNSQIDPDEYIENKYIVMQHIIRKTGQQQIIKQNVDKQKKLSIKILIQNFNSKYKLILNEDQKNILKKYILQRKSKNFNQYIKKHVSKLRYLLQQNLQSIIDQVKKIKIKQIISQLTILQQRNILKKQNIFALIYGHQIIKSMKK